VIEFVHPDYRAIVIERMQYMYKHSIPVDLIEERFIRLDGQTIDVEVVAIPTNYMGQSAIQLIIRDVTQRKRAEQIQRFLTEAGTLLTSENIKDYKGEDFENCLINTYLAMNYALMGDVENALVEARRVNHKLQLMITDGQRKYKQNAFASYLSAILYETDGDYGNEHRLSARYLIAGRIEALAAATSERRMQRARHGRAPYGSRVFRELAHARVVRVSSVPVCVRDFAYLSFARFHLFQASPFQSASLSRRYGTTAVSAMRVCWPVSRSRTVTVWSARVWPSMVKQYGQPASSMRA
jgi:hypothetical protein